MFFLSRNSFPHNKNKNEELTIFGLLFLTVCLLYRGMFYTVIITTSCPVWGRAKFKHRHINSSSYRNPCRGICVAVFRVFCPQLWAISRDHHYRFGEFWLIASMSGCEPSYLDRSCPPRYMGETGILEADRGQKHRLIKSSQPCQCDNAKNCGQIFRRLLSLALSLSLLHDRSTFWCVQQLLLTDKKSPQTHTQPYFNDDNQAWWRLSKRHDNTGQWEMSVCYR